MTPESTRYFKLGAFVLGAIAVFVALVVILGSGRFDRNRITLETYFNESVQGLDIGSKIKYRGVTVGEVTRISFTASKYETEKSLVERKQYVLVEASVRGDLLGGALAARGDHERIVTPQIDRGLRVRLTSQGITGTSYLEVDFVDPKNAPLLEIAWIPDNLYVPSAPSAVNQLLASADEIMTRLRKLDLDSTIENFNRVMVGAARNVDELKLGELSTSARALLQNGTTLVAEISRSNQVLAQQIDRLPLDKIGGEASTLIAELRRSNTSLQRVIDNPALTKLPEDAQAAVAKLRASLENPDLERSLAGMQRAIARLERLLVGRESDIATTLENLRLITDNLRDTSELAKRHPSQIFLGGPPAASSVTTSP